MRTPFLALCCALVTACASDAPPPPQSAPSEPRRPAGPWPAAEAYGGPAQLAFVGPPGIEPSVTRAPVSTGQHGRLTWMEERITLTVPARSGPGTLVVPLSPDTFAVSAEGIALHAARVPDPSGALVLESDPLLLDAGASRTVTLRSVRVASTPPAAAAAAPRGAAILLLATSAARANDLGRQLELLRRMADAQGDAPLVVAGYDERVTEYRVGTGADTGPDVARAILDRDALGATDLAGALAWVSKRAAELDARGVVVVTDGVATARGVDRGEIERALGALPATTRVDVVVPGGAASLSGLRAVVGATRMEGSVVRLHVDGLSHVFPGPPARATEIEVPDDAPAWVRALLGRPAEPEVIDRGLGLERLAALTKDPRPFASSESRAALDPLGGLPAPPADPPAPAPAPSSVAPPKPPGASSAVPPAPASPSGAASPAAGSPTEPPARIPAATIQGIVRRNFGRFRACYQEALRQRPATKGRVLVEFDIAADGTVALARAKQSDVDHPPFVACVVRAVEELSFPAPPGGLATVRYPFVFARADASGPPAPVAGGRPDRPGVIPSGMSLPKAPIPPWSGVAREVEEAALRGDVDGALSAARRARREAPRAALPYWLLGDALAAAGQAEAAARATRSVVDIAPRDGGALRLAALRELGQEEGVARAEGLVLRALSAQPGSVDLVRLAARQRALSGDLEGALHVLDGLLRETSRSLSGSASRELARTDLGIVAAVLVARDPSRATEVARWASDVGVALPEGSVFRVALVAADPSADLDLVVEDWSGARALRARPSLATGGRLVATSSGPGPEAFLGDARRASPSGLFAGLAKSGAAPFAAGSMEILEHDGAGKLTAGARPFVVQNEAAEVLAGRLEAARRLGP